MYEDFFGLKDQPFKLCTDPAYLFLGASHARARAYLQYALLKPDGIVVITGDIGTGKSTLIGSIQASGEYGTDIVVLHQTQLNAVQLLQAVMLAMGLAAVPDRKAELLDAAREELIERHACGRKTLLVIDDAHNLGARALEELRMLSDLEYGSEPLLSLVLVGQPALQRTLARSDLEQLRQRIRLHYRLEPLDKVATARYIRHRLKIAGNAPGRVFTSSCYPMIYRYTGGVPRRINLLCDMAMTAASLKEKRSVTPACVDDAVRELGWRAQPLKWRARRALRWLHDGLFDEGLETTPTVPRANPQWPITDRSPAKMQLRRMAKIGRAQWARLRRSVAGSAVATALATRSIATNWTHRRRLAPLIAVLPILLMPLLALAVTGLPSGRPAESETSAAAQPSMDAATTERVVVVLASQRTGRQRDESVAMGPPIEPVADTSDHTITVSDSAELNSVEWILGQQAQRYTIQILGTHRAQSMHRFARQHVNDLTLAYFEQVRDERDWFVLLAGNYPDLTAARAARDALPEAIRNNGPWIRKFGEIQSQLGAKSAMEQTALVQTADDVDGGY